MTLKTCTCGSKITTKTTKVQKTVMEIDEKSNWIVLWFDCAACKSTAIRRFKPKEKEISL